MNSLINLVLTGIKLGISVWQIFARSNEIKYCITSSEFEIGLQQLRQNISNLFSCNQLLNDRKLTASCVFYTQKPTPWKVTSFGKKPTRTNFSPAHYQIYVCHYSLPFNYN